MKLCYPCFLNYFSDLLDASKLWERLPNKEEPETCSHCSLKGIYVRELINIIKERLN